LSNKLKQKDMNHKKITKLQKDYGIAETQELINNGMAWKLEGSIGRHAMGLLESGACMLPKEPKIDYYGNRVPGRDELKKGTKGTYQNSVNFWKGVESGEIEIYWEDNY
jgi:hypothetical protein